jgi:hypothetical protein
MNRRLSRRVAWSLGVLAWVGAVCWYWRDSVPLRPTRTVQFPEPVQLLGFSKSGELAICHDRARPVPELESSSCGPVELWRFPEGRKVSEVLDRDDVIEGGWIDPSGQLVARRNGQVHLIDLRQPDQAVKLPTTDVRILAFTFVAGGKQVAYSDGYTIRLFDLETKREAWAADGFIYLFGAGPDFVSTTYADENSKQWIGSKAAILNLKTGQEDLRFKSLGEIFTVHAQPDSPYAVIENGPSSHICDMRSGVVLWSLPQHGNFWFDKSGEELCADVPDPSGWFETVRWRTADGTVLVPMPAGPRPMANHRKVPGGRYAINEIYLRSQVANYVNPWLKRLKAKTRWPDSQWKRRVVDLQASATVGLIPDSPNALSPDGSGFGIHERDRIDFYSLPPLRSWGWLIRWLFAPPVVFWLISVAWSRWRHVRRSAPVGIKS